MGDDGNCWTVMSRGCCWKGGCHVVFYPDEMTRDFIFGFDVN